MSKDFETLTTSLEWTTTLLTQRTPNPVRPEGVGWRLVSASVHSLGASRWYAYWFWERESTKPVLSGKVAGIHSPEGDD